MLRHLYIFAISCALNSSSGWSQTSPTSTDGRHSTELGAGWRTVAVDSGSTLGDGIERPGFDDHAWRVVDVPHNWDTYEGFHQLHHGDRHGTAWYRCTFTVDAKERGRRVFLFFEGVGSYATVWVDGRPVGRHAGGLTTFTLDVTDAVAFGGENLLAVRADHPAGIRDLPWVCGGCELAAGFSEGPQPFGIFRPVHLVITSPVRVEPFGVHVWNDNPISAAVVAHVRTEVKNYGIVPCTFALVTRVQNRRGTTVAEMRTQCSLAPGRTITVPQDASSIPQPHLWSLDDPYLYTLQTTLLEGDTVLDQSDTPFGFRWFEWPDVSAPSRGQFLLNGRQVFINGVADYEHLLGANYAFTTEQIRARIRQIEAAGFNAFRDAHYPHNLRYQQYWDRDGLLWWPQFSTHIWFDNAAFRANFKTLLCDWVKERRNSPALVLWGLQNESQLPNDFARECRAIIRELDPTASSQRKITTCNGGTGTDWNVPQNWSGTYGDDPATYAADLRRQHLVGEYGAWRSIDLHSEGGFIANGPLSEDRMAALLETKIHLAESVRDEVCGHFAWIFATHSNPGRNVGEHGEQTRDGLRELDQVGPANNKGLLTIWGEPLDAYHLYRANYAPKATQPMVYIVSHTWPDRWTAPGRESGLIIYSNCDEVELFNDYRHHSLGRRTRGGQGTHFQWDNVEIDYNVLYAEGRVGGTTVATDCIVLHHLPAAPHLRELKGDEPSPDLTAPLPGQHYLYRVNCGGPDYVDVHGQRWMADRDFASAALRGSAGIDTLPACRPAASAAGHDTSSGVVALRGSAGIGPADADGLPLLPQRATGVDAGDSWGAISWAGAYPDLAPAFGSQRRIHDPIAGTADDPLFQTFRYGRERLRYVFTVPAGDYQVELFFIEPWYGTGGSPDCTGWRLFDVAVNGRAMLHNLDLWQEAGRAHAVKKVLPVHVSDGRLEISFPRVAASQAVISAIAVSSADASLRPPLVPAPLITDLHVADRVHAADYSVCTHLDTGDRQFGDATGDFATLPGELVNANWIRTASASRTFAGPELLRFVLTADADVYVAFDRRLAAKPAWLGDWADTTEQLGSTYSGGSTFALCRRSFDAGATVGLGSNPDGDSGGAMYTVIVQRRRPPPPAQIITDLTVPGSNWRAIGNLRSGDQQYDDGVAAFTQLPPPLTQCDWIRTERHAGGVARATFAVNCDAEVYIALDARLAARPAWLSDWIDADLRLSTSGRDGGLFQLWKKRFVPGEMVTLSDNGRLADSHAAAMYSVIVRPVRPARRYDITAATFSGGTMVPAIAGQLGAAWQPGPPGSYLEWTVAVGVGDRYGLNFRYATATAEAVPLDLSIIGNDDRVLRTDHIEFPPTRRPLEWSTMRMRIGSSINAGTYRIRLTTTGASAFYLSSLEVE